MGITLPIQSLSGSKKVFAFPRSKRRMIKQSLQVGLRRKRGSSF
jgi:hypothetical protein